MSSLTWEHKLHAMADNSVEGISSFIKTQEKDGWQLATLGQSKESLTLIFKRPVQESPYSHWEHEIFRVAIDENVSRRQINTEVEKAVAKCGDDGWTIAAMGEAPEGFFLIATRPSR